MEELAATEWRSGTNEGVTADVTASVVVVTAVVATSVVVTAEVAAVVVVTVEVERAEGLWLERAGGLGSSVGGLLVE